MVYLLFQKRCLKTSLKPNETITTTEIEVLIPTPSTPIDGINRSKQTTLTIDPATELIKAFLSKDKAYKALFIGASI